MSETASRSDNGKLRLDLVSPVAIEGLATVLAFGADKYAEHNWRKGMEWSRCVASLKRHLSAFEKGVDYDPESGLRHIDHVLCNAMFLSEYQATGTGIDNRYKIGDKTVEKLTNKPGHGPKGE